MKKLALLITILLLVACGGNRSAAQADDQAGTVVFKVSPSSAEILVDGQLVGKARDYDGKRAVLKLEAGTHIITLQKEGYEKEEYKVYLSDSQELIQSDLKEIP